MSEGRGSTTTSVLAGIAGVLAVVGIVAGAIGLWARSTVLDSQRVGRAVYRVLGEEEVSDSLAVYINDQLVAVTQLDQVVDGLVPDALEPVASLVLAGARARVDERLGALIRTDQVRYAIATAAARAHAQLVDLLEGDGLVDGITVDDGEVTVNLLPLFARGLGVLQGVGLLSDLDVPDLDRAGDPDEQRAQLSEALGRDLPDDFGELVVYRSEALADAGARLSTVQRMMATISRLLWVLLVAGVALAAVSIWLAARRARAAIILGGATAVVLILVRAATRWAVERAPTLVDQPGAKRTIEDLLDGLQDSLLTSTIGYVLIALGVVVVGIVVSRSGAPD